MVSTDRLQSANISTADRHSKDALDVAREKRDARQVRTRKVILGVVSLLTSILIINALIGEQGVIAVMRARAERTTLETVTNSLQTENNELRQFADELRNDSSTIERIARDDLGLILPGEQVLIIGKPRNSDQIAPTQ